MTLTNRLGLPDSIVRAVENDSYVGGGDITVTQLILPPYLRRLRKMHPPVEDVADRIWSLIGQIGHAILERIPTTKGIAEQRLYMNMPGPAEVWTVSGQFDLLEDRKLTDFKFTSVWAGKDGGKLEWEWQLNMLRVLCAYQESLDERYAVDELQIVAIYRDWQKSKVGTTGYPTAQVEVIPITMWPLGRAVAFMAERVALHQNASPDPCTDDERWKKPDEFAIQKTGGKRAIKLFQTPEEANEWLAQQNDKDKLWVEHRYGEYRRCASYCSVSHACPQWQEKLKEAVF